MDFFILPDCTLSCGRHAPRRVRTLKITYPSVVKEYYLLLCIAPSTAQGHLRAVVKLKEQTSQLVVWKHENTAHRKREKTTNWAPPYYGCSLSPGKAAPNFPCTAFGRESYHE